MKSMTCMKWKLDVCKVLHCDTHSVRSTEIMDFISQCGVVVVAIDKINKTQTVTYLPYFVCLCTFDYHLNCVCKNRN